MGELLGLVQD